MSRMTQRFILRLLEAKPSADPRYAEIIIHDKHDDDLHTTLRESRSWNSDDVYEPRNTYDFGALYRQLEVEGEFNLDNWLEEANSALLDGFLRTTRSLGLSDSAALLELLRDAPRTQWQPPVAINYDQPAQVPGGFRTDPLPVPGLQALHEALLHPAEPPEPSNAGFASFFLEDTIDPWFGHHIYMYAPLVDTVPAPAATAGHIGTHPHPPLSWHSLFDMSFSDIHYTHEIATPPTRRASSRSHKN